ncbi:MAG: TonB-dependent receptor [Novosphingobium sp.]|nr:TonB-dependent receptor [Novosphingobium sp.]
MTVVRASRAGCTGRSGALPETGVPPAMNGISFMSGDFMRKYLFFIATCASAIQPAWAADDSAESDGIVVTATGLPQQADRTGQSITVIDRDEIESVQGSDVTRVLQRLPGTTFTRNGPFGSLTLLGVRGAPAGQTLILVDGVRANDPASANGEFDLAQLANGTIEAIELLRGPNSVVWGSQAMGGVMNITTRMQQGASASVEYGGERQVTATAAAGLVGDLYEAGISGSFVDGRGVSAADVGTERDGFRHYNIAARGKARLNDEFSFTANARYTRGKVELDGFPPPNYTFDDTATQEKLTAWSGRFGALYEEGRVTLNAAFAISDTKREGDDPSSPYTLDGRSERLELLGRVDLGHNIVLDFGADNEWTRFSNAPDSGKAENASGHALLGYYGEHLTLTGGVRYDDHSRFGGEWTVGANGAFEFVPGWRLRAGYGEGFKAPTLYQLLSQYGNEALAPERSRAFEVGVSHGERGGPLYLSLTAYTRTARNLIDFFSCWSGTDPLCATRPYGFYYNVGKGRARGIEAELGGTLAPGLSGNVVYSYTDTENRTAGDPFRGNDFARRPKHMATVSLDWRSDLGLALGADLRAVGKAWDNASNTVRNGSYALGDVRASYRLNGNIELFGRVENVWNERYTTAAGYGTQGRAAYIGIRLDT